MKLVVDENTPIGLLRELVARDRDRGIDNVHLKQLEQCLMIADLFEIPDELRFAAILAAMDTPTRLDDPDSVAYTRSIAYAAGKGKLAPNGTA
jgi:hypothetical protein